MNQKAIGGSDIAAIMGVHPGKTAFDVWLRITQGYEQEDSPILQRGRLFEPVVREMARRELGLSLTGPRDVPAFGEGFVGRASLDDEHVAGDAREVVEYKTSSTFARARWGDESAGDAPIHYLYQLQWYLMATGSERGHLVALIGLDDLRHYRVEADHILHREMVEAARAFWVEHVATEKAPSAVRSSLAESYLARKYQSPGDEYLEASAVDGADALVADYLAARERADAAEVEVDALKTRLKEAIGNAKGLRSELATVTWGKSSGRTVTDWEAVAKELGASVDTIRRHSIQKDGVRSFRVTVKGGGR